MKLIPLTQIDGNERIGIAINSDQVVYVTNSKPVRVYYLNGSDPESRMVLVDGSYSYVTNSLSGLYSYEPK